MVFLGIYRAIYDYAPQADAELAITEGDLLFVLEKDADGDWWKAKRKATEDEEEEPEGLIPSNYVEEAQPLNNARALYDYSRQTDEELSFSEDAVLQVYDQMDPDWTLVGFNGEFGFAPANYIEKGGARPGLPPRSPPVDDGYGDEESQSFSSPTESPVQSPAAALAGIIQQRTGPSSAAVMSPPRASTYTPDASDEDEAPPSLPRRHQVSSPSSLDKALPRAPSGLASPPYNRAAREQYDEAAASGGFRMYHIHEMISHLGKNRKMPTALGINVARGIITIAPEAEGTQQEWTADKLTHYSLEGKHVFLELVRPSKSIDFHATHKETAGEIVSALGELAGAARAEGLREVLAIGNGAGGQKKGHMLYEFMAQGDDEVTVAVGDDVVVLDDTQSEEWWKVRRLKNGKEGVVPRSYVEITGHAGASAGATGASAGYSGVEQNRREEERMTMEAVRTSSQQESSRRDRRKDARPAGSAKPNPSKVRQWTDRSGSFKVDAEFLGVKDGKIHLHKTNGVKIAVPTAKMSNEDIEYVEQAAGLSLDDEKQPSDRRQTEQRRSDRQVTSPPLPPSGAAVRQPDRPKYEWFDFFLQSGVAPQICERYALAFERDQMSEENLQDISPEVLRTLGLKEGDILRVMKLLDSKFGRTRPPLGSSNSTNGEGLFSGPEGVLRNNTSKGRPAPPVETNNTVDPRVFEQNNIRKDTAIDGAASTPLVSAPPKPPRTTTGFDDNAWDNKPSRQDSAPGPPSAPEQPQRPALTGALEQLSLLSPPLQPTPAPQPAPSQTQQFNQSQPNRADPSFFDQIARPSTTQQMPTPRQRPQPTQQYTNQGSILPPPPARPMSAPGSQPNNFQSIPALRPQVTGLAPQGQSLHELNQQRAQQLYAQQTGFGYGQPNGFMPQPTGYANFAPQQQPQPNYPQFIANQPTGFVPQLAPYQQPYLTNQPTGSPFADPPRAPFVPQPTGFAQPYLAHQQTGINNYAALVPQRTGFVNGFGQAPSQLPSVQDQSQRQGTPAPLVPQKTGPAPPVRFGLNSAQKLTPQMTGRRANLSQATPQNPFGF